MKVDFHMVPIVIERSKLVHPFPDTLVGRVKDMWAVFVYVDRIPIFCIAVASDMVAHFDYQAAKTMPI
jgi:hypothetical protein